MKIRQKLLRQLLNNMPSGYGKILQERLAKKGYIFSIQYIYRVLSPDYTDYNNIIIEEAIELLEELGRHRHEVEQKIVELTK